MSKPSRKPKTNAKLVAGDVQDVHAKRPTPVVIRNLTLRCLYLDDDDFVPSGHVKLGGVLQKIAELLLENGSPNRFKAERDAWPHIHTAIVLGQLHPLDATILDILSSDNSGTGVVTQNELETWGQTKGWLFIKKSDQGAGAEFGFMRTKAREFSQVDWGYWLSLRYWTPQEAACLLVEFDPNQYSQLANRNQPIAIMFVSTEN